VVALPRDPSELPAPLPDGRLVQVSKPHSYEKLFYWSRVLQEYATRTKYMWAGKRVCLDLFASCGIYQDSETKELGWGSPLLALHAIDPFDVYIFGDRNPDRASVLADRVDDSGLARAETVRVSLADPDVMRTARDFKALTARRQAGVWRFNAVRGDQVIGRNVRPRPRLNGNTPTSRFDA
jgi:hypothetical protein